MRTRGNMIIIVSKDQWLAASKTQRLQWLKEALGQLDDIHKGLHPLYGKPEAGRIATEKSALKKFIFDVIVWETECVDT